MHFQQDNSCLKLSVARGEAQDPLLDIEVVEWKHLNLSPASFLGYGASGVGRRVLL